MEAGWEREQKAPQSSGQANKGQRHSLSLRVVPEQRTNAKKRASEAAEDIFLHAPLCNTGVSLGGAQPVAVGPFFSVQSRPAWERRQP